MPDLALLCVMATDFEQDRILVLHYFFFQSDTKERKRNKKKGETGEGTEEGRKEKGKKEKEGRKKKGRRREEGREKGRKEKEIKFFTYW